MSLYALAQAGDPDALAALVRRHMPLVQALSRRFQNSEDAFQQGCVGLVSAIRRYREEEGFAFSTYAVPVILGEMRRAAARDMGWRTRNKLKRARDYQEQQLKQFGRMPPVKETAAKAGLPPEELAMLLEMEKGRFTMKPGCCLRPFPTPAAKFGWLGSAFRISFPACRGRKAGSSASVSCWAAPRPSWPRPCKSHSPAFPAGKNAPAPTFSRRGWSRKRGGSHNFLTIFGARYAKSVANARTVW